jgi:O-methyltransferase
MNLLQRIRYRLFDRRLVRLVQPYTLVGPERIQNLQLLARRAESDSIPGDFVECGVCNGGTAAVLARYASGSRLQRTVWLFDSFQGMPETSPEDGDAAKAHVGKEVGNQVRVQEVLKLIGARMERVRIVPGWFEQTFPTVSIGQIALLNIDADWYSSVKLCLESYYDLVVRGGFISIDDYGHWPGCRQAVDEFFETRRLSYPLRKVDYTAHWFQKE